MQENKEKMFQSRRPATVKLRSPNWVWVFFGWIKTIIMWNASDA